MTLKQSEELGCMFISTIRGSTGGINNARQISAIL